MMFSTRLIMSLIDIRPIPSAMSAVTRARFNISDDFEDGIDRWTVLNGTWRTAEQAAFRGRFGLVDSINFGTANETQTIETPDIDLTMARNPRLAFLARFDVPQARVQAEILVGGAVQDVFEVFGPGNSGQDARLFAYDLSAYRGEGAVKVRIKVPMGNEEGLGAWIDEFRVDEAPERPAQFPPVIESFDNLDRWVSTAGAWSFSPDGWGGGRAIEVGELETKVRGESFWHVGAWT